MAWIAKHFDLDKESSQNKLKESMRQQIIDLGDGVEDIRSKVAQALLALKASD